MAQVTIKRGAQVYHLQVNKGKVRAEKGVPVSIQEVNDIIRDHRTQILVALFLDECAETSIRDMSVKMKVSEQAITNARYNWGTANRPPRSTWLKRLEEVYGKNLPK